MNRHLTPRTLRGRLALMALATGALWIGVLTTVFNLALDKRLHGQADDVLRTRAEAVAATVDVRPDGRLVVREPAEDRALDAGVWIFQGGTVIEKPPTAPAGLEAQAARLAGRRETFADTKGPGSWRLYAFPVDTPAREGHPPVRAGTVVSSVNLDPYRSTADTALIGSIALAVLLLATIYLLTRLVVRRALRPVTAMSEQATRWSAAGAPERFGAEGRPAELATFATSLDALLDRLAAVLRHEQQQAAELSHELRTPLARITAETEWLTGRPRTAEQQETSLAAIAGAAATMQQICDSLLSEVRTRNTHTPGRSRFPDIAHRLAQRYAAQFPDAPPLTVTADGTQDVAIGVSEDVAERILTPLLDNARRYATRSVALTCAPGAGEVTLYVSDDGPGVPPDFVASLFEPGRRAHPEDGHDGAGLGLALARRLARAAGGDITLDATAPGARFVVTLPTG
ncbi:ATP-binding protein [Streptomyces sp. NBC_01363]|uniref:ATP-binding protein n=1 Tax=Streptomyces sp. NBC_01363 TaxID=2903840 RepID=UPI0022554F6E|nr:ATP-binding protein [Streptomyces sp. NBC_01363]MCX4730458.1 ATP-binding protein [Streptomyces sp. NBC_01363]